MKDPSPFKIALFALVIIVLFGACSLPLFAHRWYSTHQGTILTKEWVNSSVAIRIGNGETVSTVTLPYYAAQSLEVGKSYMIRTYDQWLSLRVASIEEIQP